MFSLLNIYYTPSFSYIYIYIYIEMSTQLKLFGLVKKKHKDANVDQTKLQGSFSNLPEKD